MQNLKKVITIVPNLPPAIDGVGDYGYRLAQQLFEEQGWQTHFIVGDPTYRSITPNHFSQTSVVTQRSPDSLAALLSSTDAVVLLHYAGHGYAKRGCPTWLVADLRDWCQRGGRLITMFHELYATRPLLSSAILTSPVQKRLAVQLMQMSDRVLTSQQNYAERIESLSHQKHTLIPILPVFSTVGECLKPQPLAQRQRQLVVFGGTAVRSRVYTRSQTALAKICRELDIKQIIDIGPQLKIDLNCLEGIPVEPLGILSAAEVSQYLSSAIAGFLDYGSAYLGKSTIFAAYCSHGMIPIVATDQVANKDELISQRHYWAAGSNHHLDINQGQTIAIAAHAWYQTHNLKTQAQIFADCLSRNEKVVSL